MKTAFILILLFLAIPTVIFAQRPELYLYEDGETVDLREYRQQRQIKQLKELPSNMYQFLQSLGQAGGNATPTPSSGTPTPSEQPLPTVSPGANDLNLPLDNEVVYPANIVNTVTNCLQNQDVYKQAESYTGVNWKILAGIHYVEGGCNPNKSLVSGRPIGGNEPDVHGNCSWGDTGLGKPHPISGGCAFESLLDTAVYGGNHLKGKIRGQVPSTLQDLAYALGRYNGLGNRNCGKTPYQHCPPSFDNDDHIYPMSKLDKKHETMYLVFCADYTRCNPPVIFQRIGVLTVAKILTQNGY